MVDTGRLYLRDSYSLIGLFGLEVGQVLGCYKKVSFFYKFFLLFCFEFPILYHPFFLGVTKWS